MKKILWVFGPKAHAHTGIGNYSTHLLSLIHGSPDLSIDEKWMEAKPKSLKHYFLFLFYIPLFLFLKSKKYDNVVLYEEAFSFFLPFIRTKSIIIVHDVRSDFNKSESLRMNLKKKIVSKLNSYLNLASKIVSPSDFTRTALKNVTTNKNLLVAYNSIQLEEFRKKPLDKSSLFEKHNIPINKNTIYLLYVGSEETRKNFITLLDTLEILESNYHLIKIGKPVIQENRELHLKKISQSKLNVTIIDFISQEDLINFYQNCDIFLFPSTFEGFGRPPAEAQAAGLPVISTHCASLKEIVADSAIIVNNPTDPIEWKSAIEKLSDPQEQDKLIQLGYQNCKRFSVENQAKIWLEILEA